ncbi:MAG: hypothetical protein KJ046_02000 [Anaerolineae bacterium]|nr:hypothetical protein [Anaerolineae bacterium]RIK19892.1 MAG: hypothetical protein DCC51_08225 [Anaerolineae bacterium]
MPFNRLILIGFVLAVIGAVLPFLIVMRVVPSTYLTNFLAYTASTLGIFLAVIGVAMYVGGERRKNRDDWDDK